MPIVNPLPKEHAAADVQAVHDNLRQVFGHMPNIFAVMAYRPGVLNAFLPPNSDIIAGQQAIHTFWHGAMHMGITAAQLDIIEVEDHGHTANEVGKYTLQGVGSQVLDTGKYVVIWQQEAGQWKIHCDIWNSSRPASGQ